MDSNFSGPFHFHFLSLIILDPIWSISLSSFLPITSFFCPVIFLLLPPERRGMKPWFKPRIRLVPFQNSWVPLEVFTTPEQTGATLWCPVVSRPSIQHSSSAPPVTRMAISFLPHCPQTSLNTVNQVHHLPAFPDSARYSSSSPLHQKSSHMALSPSGNDEEVPLRPNPLWSTHTQGLCLQREKDLEITHSSETSWLF